MGSGEKGNGAMKQKRSIAKMAVSAGLALAMAAGMAAPATVAFADTTYGTGSIVISKKDDAYTQSFLGYQIFKANVKDDSSSTTGKKESNIAWASDNVKTAVKTATSQTFATAQDAADWIAQNVTGTSSTTAVDATSPAYKIAEAVKASGATATPINAGEAKSLDEGYWVFVMDPDSKLSSKETGTAPIFAVVGGSAVKVTEKVSDNSIPTPGKEIVNPDGTTGDNSKGGSVAVGDTTTYELSATIPENIASYKTYKLVFTDTLSEGLDYAGNVNSAQLVKADGTKVALKSAPTVSTKGQTQTFTYTDLKSVLPEDYKYAKGDKIVFRYDAKVNDKAKAGTDIYNQVVLEYSNDPSSTGTGTTVEQPQTHQYTYKLVLNKVDLGTEAALPGATFTVANASDKPVNYNGQSYNKGAVLATVPTDSKGALTVEGLDAGTYTIKETAAPTGYTAAADVTVTIAPTFNGDGTIATLGNNLTSRDDVIAGKADNTPGDNVLQAKAETASDANAGTVTVTIGDRKQITMPLTGMKGTTALLVYGSAILVISAGAYLKHRKNQSEDDAQ